MAKKSPPVETNEQTVEPAAKEEPTSPTLKESVGAPAVSEIMAPRDKPIFHSPIVAKKKCMKTDTPTAKTPANAAPPLNTMLPIYTDNKNVLVFAYRLDNNRGCYVHVTDYLNHTWHGREVPNITIATTPTGYQLVPVVDPIPPAKEEPKPAADPTASIIANTALHYVENEEQLKQLLRNSQGSNQTTPEAESRPKHCTDEKRKNCVLTACPHYPKATQIPDLSQLPLQYPPHLQQYVQQQMMFNQPWYGQYPYPHSMIPYGTMPPLNNPYQYAFVDPRDSAGVRNTTPDNKPRLIYEASSDKWFVFISQKLHECADQVPLKCLIYDGSHSFQVIQHGFSFGITALQKSSPYLAINFEVDAGNQDTNYQLLKFLQDNHFEDGPTTITHVSNNPVSGAFRLTIRVKCPEDNEARIKTHSVAVLFFQCLRLAEAQKILLQTDTLCINPLSIIPAEEAPPVSPPRKKMYYSGINQTEGLPVVAHFRYLPKSKKWFEYYPDRNTVRPTPKFMMDKSHAMYIAGRYNSLPAQFEIVRGEDFRFVVRFPAPSQVKSTLRITFRLSTGDARIDTRLDSFLHGMLLTLRTDDACASVEPFSIDRRVEVKCTMLCPEDNDRLGTCSAAIVKILECLNHPDAQQILSRATHLDIDVTSMQLDEGCASFRAHSEKHVDMPTPSELCLVYNPHTNTLSKYVPENNSWFNYHPVNKSDFVSKTWIAGQYNSGNGVFVIAHNNNFEFEIAFSNSAFIDHADRQFQCNIEICLNGVDERIVRQMADFLYNVFREENMRGVHVNLRRLSSKTTVILIEYTTTQFQSNEDLTRYKTTIDILECLNHPETQRILKQTRDVTIRVNSLLLSSNVSPTPTVPVENVGKSDGMFQLSFTEYECLVTTAGKTIKCVDYKKLNPIYCEPTHMSPDAVFTVACLQAPTTGCFNVLPLLVFKHLDQRFSEDLKILFTVEDVSLPGIQLLVQEETFVKFHYAGDDKTGIHMTLGEVDMIRLYEKTYQASVDFAKRHTIKNYAPDVKNFRFTAVKFVV